MKSEGGLVDMNRLKELRESAGLTMRGMGKLIPISRTVLSFLESEQRPFRERHIEVLTNFFQVTTDYLRGYSDYGLLVYFFDTPDGKEDCDYVSGRDYQNIRARIRTTETVGYGSGKTLNINFLNESHQVYDGAKVFRHVEARRNDLQLEGDNREALRRAISGLTESEAVKVLHFIKDYIKG